MENLAKYVYGYVRVCCFIIVLLLEILIDPGVQNFEMTNYSEVTLLSGLFYQVINYICNNLLTKLNISSDSI